MISEFYIAVYDAHLTVNVFAFVSGKSSLLSAILGEMKRQRGHVHLYTSEFTSPSSLSIATQKPWIFAASVRENVVFERPFESERYARVLRACQLTDDIQALSAGDATVIGERGVNLVWDYWAL